MLYIQNYLETNLQSTESASSTSDLMAAVWIIVKEWSEVLLGSKFESFIALAYHLITKSSIGIGTKYADLISESIEKQTKGKVISIGIVFPCIII